MNIHMNLNRIPMSEYSPYIQIIHVLLRVRVGVQPYRSSTDRRKHKFGGPKLRKTAVSRIR